MKRVLEVAVCFCSLAALPLSAEVITNIKIPTAIQAFVPCAAAGAGELVLLSGDLHILLAVTMDANGGVHVKDHFQPQGISGFGTLTGAKYQATGVTQDDFNVQSPGYPFEETYINRFHIVGQGPGNDFYVQETFHITVNANGTATALVDNFKVVCK